MKKFKFEIQNCINVTVEAKDKESARMKVINNLEDYADQMVDGDCYISEGTEVKK